MPRQTPRRAFKAFRPDPAQEVTLERLAERETNGNFSEIVRKLINEALSTRGELS